MIGLDFGRCGLKFGKGLFGDDKLRDNLFEMVVQVFLFGVGGRDVFEGLRDGCHI